MAIDKVFPNPTVKLVVFAIKFSNLFYIESKIGEFQVKIIEQFPESELLFRRHVTFADLGPQVNAGDLPPELRESSGKKIWQFRSPNQTILDVSADSLAITSEFHKTYQLGDEDKFRDTIQFVIDRFLEVVELPKFKRIGLRYVDECPVPSKDNETFLDYYNTAFPLDRFNIADATEMDFKTVVNREQLCLRYIESLRRNSEADSGYSLIMDFDGYQSNIDSKTYLETTDRLHELILSEYESSINQPLINHMSKKGPIE